MGWWTFVTQASVSGWKWFVEVWNHFGAVLGVLALVTGAALSLTVRWWIALPVLGAIGLLIFLSGAFLVWRDAVLDAQRLDTELGLIRSGSDLEFPQMEIVAKDDLWLDPESHGTAESLRSLVFVRIRVTNRERDRHANLHFEAFVEVSKPFERTQKLSRPIDVADKLGLPDPVKVEPQDTVSGDVFFSWPHDLDFVFGPDIGPREVAQQIGPLSLSVTDYLSGETIKLAVPGRWPE